MEREDYKDIFLGIGKYLLLVIALLGVAVIATLLGEVNTGGIDLGLLFILLFFTIVVMYTVIVIKEKEIIIDEETNTLRVISGRWTIRCLSISDIKEVIYENVPKNQSMGEKMPGIRVIPIRSLNILRGGEINIPFGMIKDKDSFIKKLEKARNMKEKEDDI